MQRLQVLFLGCAIRKLTKLLWRYVTGYWGLPPTLSISMCLIIMVIWCPSIARKLSTEPSMLWSGASLMWVISTICSLNLSSLKDSFQKLPLENK